MRCQLVIVILGAAGNGPAYACDPFDDARLIPATVSTYLHVEEAATICADLSTRPLATWAASMAKRGQLPGAWARLARACGYQPAPFFEMTMGRRLTIVLRPASEPDGQSEWAALTVVSLADSDRVLQRLQPRRLAPVKQVAIFHVPDHELLIARHGERIVVGPFPAARLFHEIVGNLVIAPAASLATSEPLRAVGELGAGRAALYVRHPQPMGGWSIAVADHAGDTVTLRHAARFTHAPFQEPPGRFRFDVTPITALETQTILAFIEPTRRGGGPLDAFLLAGSGDVLLGSGFGANLGARQITMIDDLDGRLAEPPFDGMLPVIARAYEVNDPDRAWEQLDKQVLSLVRRFDSTRGDAAEGVEPQPLLDAGRFEPGRARSLEVGPLVSRLFADLPGSDRVTLNWTVQAGPERNWAIVATDPDHLRRVAAVLADTPTEGEGRAWANCGTVDGPRLAEHLRGWRANGHTVAAVEQVDLFHEGLTLMSQLADGIQRARWRIARPTAQEIRSTVELKLTPSDSAAAETGTPQRTP